MSNTNWGAIPRSLAESVSLMLNKKLGVSTGFKPSEWANAINLLGELPVKTASGAIASFSDGADDVPIKSASFGIVASGGNGTPSTPVPIVGKSSVTVYHGKKNFLNFSDFSTYSNWKTDITSNSSYPTSSGNRGYLLPTRAGVTYTISFGMTAESFPTYFYLCKDDGSASTRLANFAGSSYNTNTATFTAEVGCIYYMRMSPTGSATSFNEQISKLTYAQLEVGSTATTPTAYTAPETVTIQLGQTVYGGTLAENGTLTITHALVPFSDCTWAGVTSYQSNFNSTNGIVSLRFGKNAMASAGYAQKASTALCNIFDNQNRSVWNNASRLYEIGYSDGITFNVHYSDIGLSEWTSNGTNTANAFRASSLYSNGYFALELATPIVITGLDEISLSTYLGDNSIWCDSGDTSITYRASIT